MRGRDPLTLALAALLLYAALVGVVAVVVIGGTPGGTAAALDREPEHAAVAVRPAIGTAEVVVPEGAGADAIAQLLVEAGVLDETRTFRLLLDYQGAASELHAGRYELPRPAPAADVIRRLRVGLTDERFLCVPEGLRLEEIGELLVDGRADAPPGCVGESVVTAAEWEQALAGPRAHPLLVTRPEGATLEGYLAPRNYPLRDETTAESLLAAMLDALAEVVTPELIGAADARGLALHELLTLASIVEREAALVEEQPLVASVFLNRLDAGIALQADPTVQYAIATSESVELYGWWKVGLTLDDLAVESPYNSYLVAGLPPGPIAAPGAAAIRAVVEAPETELLYFVADESCDGATHAFAETLDEHNANVARYRAACE